MSKLTTLEQLKMLATRVAAEDADLSAKIEKVTADVEGIIATGGEENVLEGVKVNGTALPIAEKMVDILIAAGSENGAISVNGADVGITGLQALAFKANVSEADLDEALTAVIAAKATQTDLDALTLRVTNAEGQIEEIKAAGYQTSAQVSAAIASAISASGHAHFEKVETDPTSEGFDAQENVLYLYMNADTGHYDIYALVSGKIELIDDTTVDLSSYSTTEQMTAAINAAIDALSIGDYAKLADLNAALDRITAIEKKFDDYVTEDELAETLDPFATEEEAKTIAEEAVAASIATDEEVSAMINEVFGEE